MKVIRAPIMEICQFSDKRSTNFWDHSSKKLRGFVPAVTVLF